MSATDNQIKRAERLGIEPLAADHGLSQSEANASKQFPLQEREMNLSVCISLKRIADRLDDIASGAATINAYTKEG